MHRTFASIVGFAALSLAAGGPAVAQKSDDTIRLSINDVFSVLDTYHFPQDEAGAFTRTMYQHLIRYNEHEGKWVPELAKSWKRIDPRTLEFQLNEKAVFSNGNPFTAEDVKHTIDYLRDPKVRVRFKGRYTWVERVEVLGPHKVRIVAKKPTATDLGLMAYRFRFYDAEFHKTLDDPANYGKTAPVTGPYKLVSLDRNEGVTVERVENYWSDYSYHRAPVKRVKGVFMPDRQTQKAELMTGGIELMRNITADDERLLAQQPGIAVTAQSSGMLMYLTMDEEGRSENKVMTDERVRKAVVMAIDREALQDEILPGGDAAYLARTICFPWMLACADKASAPYSYDPAQAKKLLAEAGYPDGFDLTLKVFAPIKYVGEAVSGQLREVGIRASIEPLPLSSYVRQRGDGQFTAFVGYYPTSSHPDTANMWNFFFGANRDYWNDELIDKVAKAGETEFDEAKRAEIYKPGFARINEGAYLLPISELPMVWAHAENVKILKNPISATESRLGDYAWSDYKEKM